MGLYDTLIVEDGIDLPKFPPDRRPSEIEWQTKEIGHPYMKTYKLTAAGELLRKEQDRREKTAAEKSAEAEEHGFDSREDYRSFCENADSQELLDRGLGLAGPTEQTVATEFWLNHNMHGSFEFHGKHDAIEAGFHWSTRLASPRATSTRSCSSANVAESTPKPSGRILPRSSDFDT